MHFKPGAAFTLVLPCVVKVNCYYDDDMCSVSVLDLLDVLDAQDDQWSQESSQLPACDQHECFLTLRQAKSLYKQSRRAALSSTGSFEKARSSIVDSRAEVVI